MEKENGYDFYVDPDSEESVFAVSRDLERPDGMVEGFASTHETSRRSLPSKCVIHLRL